MQSSGVFVTLVVFVVLFFAFVVLFSGCVSLLLNYATYQNICWHFFCVSRKTLVFVQNFQDSL